METDRCEIAEKSRRVKFIYVNLPIIIIMMSRYGAELTNQDLEHWEDRLGLREGVLERLKRSCQNMLANRFYTHPDDTSLEIELYRDLRQGNLKVTWFDGDSWEYPVSTNVDRTSYSRLCKYGYPQYVNLSRVVRDIVGNERIGNIPSTYNNNRHFITKRHNLAVCFVESVIAKYVREDMVGCYIDSVVREKKRCWRSRDEDLHIHARIDLDVRISDKRATHEGSNTEHAIEVTVWKSGIDRVDVDMLFTKVVQVYLEMELWGYNSSCLAIILDADYNEGYYSRLEGKLVILKVRDDGQLISLNLAKRKDRAIVLAG